MMLWRNSSMDEGPLHVYPLNDLIEHEIDRDCICGPECVPMKHDDGGIEYVYVHHSLDNREAKEGGE